MTDIKHNVSNTLSSFHNNFFNSSVSGKNPLNFSGIFLLVFNLATPIALSTCEELFVLFFDE